MCSLLIDRCDPRTKSALSISQIIMHQYQKTCSHDITANRKHLKHRETPVPIYIYIGLKLYATVRAKTLFFLGICISYDRCLDICNHIASSLLKKYERVMEFLLQVLCN